MPRGFNDINVQKNAMNFNAPISAPNGATTQKWDKMSGFVKASWRILEDSITSKTSWIVLSEWSIAGTKTQICLQKADPWAAPTGAERGCNKAGSTSTEPGHILHAHAWLWLQPQAHCTAFHYNRLFSSLWLCFGFVLRTLLVTLVCFHQCWAVLTKSQGLCCLFYHPPSK